ncbi:hypothetical protein [Prosthecobacter fluviatilis]|uniref:Lipoprotein n=1 Tax=Prosthecobacter fluviatilis TaxID=445931 RepID=A0ABW0KU77_9BACT
MKSSRSRGAAICATLLALSLCSCKEQQAVFKEKADLETELQKTKGEAEFLETQINSVPQGLYYAGIALQNQAKTSEATNQQLEQEIATLSSKSERLDAALKKFRPRFEAYKAKYLR